MYKEEECKKIKTSNFAKWTKMQWYVITHTNIANSRNSFAKVK